MNIKYYCQYCGAGFGNPEDCQHHEETDHIHTISILGDKFGGALGKQDRGLSEDGQYYPTVVYIYLSNGEVGEFWLHDVKNRLKDFPDVRRRP